MFRLERAIQGFLYMKILSWNCRGLGSHWTISYLRETWHKHKPDFLFLSETKQDFEFVQWFQPHFGYDSLTTVDPNGRSGGLALFYNNEYQVKILYSSNRMMDIEAVVKGKQVFLTFVYGGSGAKAKRTGMGETNSIWIGTFGTLVYYWRSKRNYWEL